MAPHLAVRLLKESYIGKASTHTIGGNQKRSLQSTNADQKPLETVFMIAICCQSGGQMAIENSVSSNFLSTFIHIINVFYC